MMWNRVREIYDTFVFNKTNKANYTMICRVKLKQHTSLGIV
jgi:hypothetical protein